MLGTALAIKMIVYVGVAPIVGGLANLLPRRAFLVSMDLTRAAVALALPFVDQAWQVYLLIFVLQSASAAFTPTFQATIPDVLPDEAPSTPVRCPCPGWPTTWRALSARSWRRRY